MSVWGALAGGFVGTLVLTTGLRLSNVLGLSRMDIPLLLGTVFSTHRRYASVIGYFLHFANGLVFSLGYAAIFAAVGRAGWLFGAALGLVHATFAGSFANIILPAVHPRMGSPFTDAQQTPILEPPGFMLTNYGPHTVIVTIVAHIAYGAIVGGFAAGL